MKPIPIGVLGYNRPKSLQRVLDSLRRADYPYGLNVPLHINVDGGGPNGTAELAESFEWPFGDKIVNVRPKSLGMRENSLQTGDLCLDAGAMIFVEDDSFLSPAFYLFCQTAFETYEHARDVFALSLYSFEFCEFDHYRFSPLLDAYDNYFVQSATTWATMFFRDTWVPFRAWLGEQDLNSITLEDGVPEAVTRWPATSWKRFINKYLIRQRQYFAYPRMSFATNFAEKGSHFVETFDNYKVRLAHVLGGTHYSTPQTSGARYDASFEIDPALLAPYLDGIDPAELDVDLRQVKRLSQLKNPYVLTTRASSHPIARYGNLHLPLESNLIYRNDGDWISLTRRDDLVDKSALSQAVLSRYYHSDLGRRRELGLFIDRVRSLVKR